MNVNVRLGYFNTSLGFLKDKLPFTISYKLGSITTPLELTYHFQLF